MNLVALDLLASVLKALGLSPSYASPLWRGLKLLLVLLVARALWRWWRWWRQRREPGPSHVDFGDRPDHYNR